MSANSPRSSGARFVSYLAKFSAGLVVIAAGYRALLATTGVPAIVEFLLGAVYGGLILGVCVAAVWGIAALCSRIPGRVLILLIGSVLAAAWLATLSPTSALQKVLARDLDWPLFLSPAVDAPSVAIVVLGFAALFGLLAALRVGRDSADRKPTAAALATATVLVGTGAWIVSHWIDDGEDSFPTEFRTFAEPLPAALDAPDPSASGPYAVTPLTYGAGENSRRPEFGVDRDLESRTVDAAALLGDWKELKKQAREWYWGFGLDAAPLNGRAWVPSGDGPFPLALIVHGNHAMEDYSDAGYAYLGELLASHGIIAVSLDENYINGTWSGDFRGKEMPLRAWLMLEHLALWRDWNADPAHRFAGQVNIDSVALLGHSRGGEAVSMAYLFNTLSHYPDDATIEFDYGFGIQSLVAIAQVDQRYHRRVELGDVNFLTLHGSYDSDEPAYHGLRQFNRIALAPDEYRIKAGVYIHRANHGQFNTTWGRSDYSPPGSWLLNLAPIVPAAEQQQIAKVYIAAFLDATLRERSTYLPLFVDARVGASWLPDQILINQFTDSTYVPIADFEEDLDVTTGSASAVEIATSGLTLWREEALEHRDERPQGSNAVVLGWREGAAPIYELQLPDGFWDAVGAADTLTFGISASTETLPDPPENDDAEKGNDNDDTDEAVLPPRFEIDGMSDDGRVATVSSASVAHLAPPLEVQFLKSKRRNDDAYNLSWEPVLQTVDLPLARLAPGGQREALRRIRFRFSSDADGVVILDTIGLRDSAARN